MLVQKLLGIILINNKGDHDEAGFISRSLVNLAVQEGVGVIVMEKLSGI